ncbi:MAG: hypothetical protein AAF747_00665 [Planctomycetota bacterium]
MPVTFKGQALFGTGPQRVRVSVQGHRVVSYSTIDFDPSRVDTELTGPEEVEVVVSGRLVAATEAALWALRDGIANAFEPAVFGKTGSPVPGVLASASGRQWADMTFVEYIEGDRTDKGRVWSIEFEAVFRKLLKAQ